MLTREDEFTSLVVDGNLCRHEAALPLRCKFDYFKSRIKGVSGVHLFEESARQFCKCDEDVPNVLRKERCARS